MEAGWTGLLVREDRGGAGLHAIDAMLVFAELGRVLASVPLLGHLPATLLMDAAAPAAEMEPLAAGSQRAAYVPARPPTAVEDAWTADPRAGLVRAPAPTIAAGRVSGEAAWVPDAPGADLLVVAGAEGRVAVVSASDAEIEPVRSYDATRSLGPRALRRRRTPPSSSCPTEPPRRRSTSRARCSARRPSARWSWRSRPPCAYAKERFTFGRAIGSYQAVKHELVEILRRLENARSLMYYAGWAGRDEPEEFALAASAFRLVAGEGLDHASRAQISVHGGIGATWEHDAPLYYRRAQLAKRLLGGTGQAADRVADELFAQARAEAAAA